MKKNMFKWRWLVAALAAAICVTACSDSDDEKNGNTNGNGEEQTEQSKAGPVETFDDLSFFQNAIVQIDSLGNFVERNYGEPLYDNDTTQLYIGVDNMEEAYEIFKDWLAPDVQISTQTPTTNNVVVTLTDTKGTKQGEVYFKAGTESSQVAQVTTNATIKHFNSVTFIYNSAWPFNAQKGKYILGSTYPMKILTGTEYYSGNRIYKDINMVCIRSQKNGVPPMFMGISKEKKSTKEGCERFYTASNAIPDVMVMADGIPVKKTLTASEDTWNFFVNVFAMTGNGPLDKKNNYWINCEEYYGIATYQTTINFENEKMFETYESKYTAEEFYVIYIKKSSRLVGDTPIQYVERSWDNETQTVKSEEKTINEYYTIENQSNDIVKTEGDWYVIANPNVKINTLVVKSADTHLILADGAKLTVNHVEIAEGMKLTIHGGPKDTGVLWADNTQSIDGIDDPVDFYRQYHEAPGIGSSNAKVRNPGSKMGTLVVMGGDIYAKGYYESAGIGGADGKNGGTVQIYGGRVIAHGDKLAAGIGGGDGGHGGTFEMYGGYVEGHGGADGAGIGGGEGGNGGYTKIYGGTLWAWGYAEGGKERSNSFGAGIGGGQDGNGGDIEIRGGDVKAYGGEDSAGIGGGEDGDSGTIKIYGGKVYAEGKCYGAGIGAGEDAACPQVEVYGGEIHAVGGDGNNGSTAWARSFGSYINNGYDTNIVLGKTLKVWRDGEISVANDRAQYCRFRREIWVTPCDHKHQGTLYTPDTCPYCLTNR